MKAWKIGDTYWRGSIDSPANHDQSGLEDRDTKQEAISDVMDIVGGWTDRERSSGLASVWQYIVTAVEDDGSIGMSEVVSGTSEDVDV
jgi:hypothetical protein